MYTFRDFVEEYEDEEDYFGCSMVWEGAIEKIQETINDDIMDMAENMTATEYAKQLLVCLEGMKE